MNTALYRKAEATGAQDILPSGVTPVGVCVTGD